MATLYLALLLCVSAPYASAVQDTSNPLGKVFELMAALEAKIVKEGEAEAKAFKEFFEWCDTESQNLNNEIKTGKTQKGKLEAKIGELTSDIDVGESKIEELAAALASNEADLKDATAVRTKEHAEFAANEKELVEEAEMNGGCYRSRHLWSYWNASKYNNSSDYTQYRHSAKCHEPAGSYIRESHWRCAGRAEYGQNYYRDNCGCFQNYAIGYNVSCEGKSEGVKGSGYGSRTWFDFSGCSMTDNSSRKFSMHNRTSVWDSCQH